MLLDSIGESPRHRRMVIGFKATNAAVFTFEPDGNQTVVNWSMSGRNNFFCKAMSLVMNMDKMVGGDFEKGLANLKAVVEKKPK